MITFDEAKREENIKKHGIDLATCDPIFDGPMETREDDSEAYGERRLKSFGILDGDVVVLLWTEREQGAHVFSCRRAVRYERKRFYDSLKK